MASPKTCMKCKDRTQQWQQGNRDHCREWERSYYQNNNGKERKQRWRQNNRAIVNEIARQWRINNPESYKNMCRTARHRRRALKLNATIEYFTATELTQYWVENGIHPDRCFYCGGPYEHDDHVIPLSRGGTHERANIVPACQPCNNRKYNKLPEEWGVA